MLESISPYALLCASKPKPISAPPDAYDLFSQIAQQQGSAAAPAQQSESLSSARIPDNTHQSAGYPEYAPIKTKTHYIADIHARHSKANRHAGQTHRPL